MGRINVGEQVLAFVASDGRKGHVLDWVVLVPDALDGRLAGGRVVRLTKQSALGRGTRCKMC